MKSLVQSVSAGAVSSIQISICTAVCFGCRCSHFSGILNPADLRRRAVALFVLSSDAKDNGWPVGGGAVNVGVVQMGGANGAGSLDAAVDPDKGHLTWPLRAAGAALSHRHVHGILQDPA